MSGARVPAVGGTRDVPAPDDVARDYILLGLRLDQHLPGTVDGYFGPAALKATVDMEQLRSPAGLAGDAADLRARLPTEVAEPDRRAWLDAQLVALETLARVKAGEPISYLDQVERCLTLRPERRPDAMFERAARDLDGLLPGTGSLADRLAAEDAAWTVDPERVAAVVDGLVPRFRERAGALFGLPPAEALRVSLVHDQPWSGYNWYDGGYRSRVDLNLDLPIRLPDARRHRGPRDLPRAPPRAREKEQVLVEQLGAARVVDPADQHARVPAVRGPRERRSRHRRPARTRWPVSSSSWRPVAGLPMAGDAGALRTAARARPPWRRCGRSSPSRGSTPR